MLYNGAKITIFDKYNNFSSKNAPKRRQKSSFHLSDENKFSTTPVDKPVDKMLKTNWRLFRLYHLQFPNFECLSIFGIIAI